MKLIGIIISKCYPKETRPIFLCTTHDVSSFSFTYRNAVKDVSKFLTREIIPRLKVGQREVIGHEDYKFCAMRWSDGLAVAMLTDKDYPPRVAFQCLTKVHHDFKSKVPEQFYKAVTDDGAAASYKDVLREFLKEFKDPSKFDAVTSTQQKVDESKKIVQRRLDDVLDNMQNLDKLVEQSDDLSTNTQVMFKTAKKMKKGCCKVT
ncbi:SNARE protein [Gregarina niphandrodes]|uniref:SNARE protein n=1 Tax=Gregarina niphandrodes TaxID=110365 RepID=A0A023B5W2_GRENI|nr:SNARE protein [Gregarina niphandrodes]EZG63420.1 SNARE protein [Gregarina niphandrodes]|eukprot:XP_011130682.1 SNARE protein [Gregarina niphandrodes]